MTLPDVIVPPELQPGGEIVERDIPNVGLVRFENFPPGTWMTQKGEPAKIARRRYLLGGKDGEEMDSVSSIGGTLDKFGLRVWIEREATAGAVAAERMGELVGVHPDDWVGRVKSLGLGATAKKEEGADRGTAIHKAFETLAKEGRPPNPAEFADVARPWVRGAVRAWMALDPEPVEAEQIVCDPQRGFAGRYDLLARVEGKLCLLDYKTARSGRVYGEAHWTTRLYEMGLAAEGIEVERILIIGIGDDGGFEVIECACSWRDADALLAVYRARKAIDRSMADQRAFARAVAS